MRPAFRYPRGIPMRAPRYRFPNEVRSTTRDIASRMVRDRQIAQTPEELDSWISRAPNIKESLDGAGYGTAFTSDDLFPLLQVFVVQAGGPVRTTIESSARRPVRAWLLGIALLLVLVLLLAVMMTGALS